MIDTDGGHWLLGATASGSIGTWRYRMVTESDIRAANYWAALVA